MDNGEVKVKRRSRINYKELNAKKRFANEDILAEVSEELDIPIDVVKGIVEAQSEFTAITIRSGGLETIMYAYLGKFKVNPYQIQKMMANQMKI